MSLIEPFARPRTPTLRPLSVEELRRRAAGRLADRLDPAKNKFKPLSILRVEARRAVEQFLDAEAPGLSRPDRDRLVEEVLTAAGGMGPLEELFRDEAVAEFMILAHNQIIARKGDGWLPTSVTFGSAEQYRQALAQFGEQGDPLAAPTAGGFHVRLANGFRVLAVRPPAVMDQPPLATFVRGQPAKSGTLIDTSGPTPKTDVIIRPPPPATAGPPSDKMPRPASGVVSFNESRPANTGSTSRMHEPLARVKQKATERLIQRLAAAGVYDLSAVPGNELRLVVMGYVEEVMMDERMTTSAAEVERLTLEILKGMHR